MKKHKIAKTIAATALAVSMLLGGTVLYASNKTKDYSDDKQIETIAHSLECDLSYLKNNPTGNINRMRHNNGEPIYVSISKNFNDEELEYLNNSLDYVFGIVGDINSNYTYKIVDENELIDQAKKGKTTISYELGEAISQNKFGETHNNGLIFRKPDKFLKITTGKSLYNSHVIVYDRESHESLAPNEIQYTFLHELLHAFGFDDVYNITASYSFIPKFCGNTLMNVSLGDNLNCLTPNDYRCIISTYAPKMDNEKLISFINKYKQKCSEYDDTYYKSFSALCEYKTKSISNLDTSKPYTANYTRKLTKLDGSVVVEKIFIEASNGKYKITITDENGKLLDSTTGETYDCGNSLIFKNAQLEKGIRPTTEDSNVTSYINDFILMRNEKGQLCFYDLASNDNLYLNESSPEKTNTQQKGME